MTFPEALQTAFDHYTAGRPQVAESIYRQLLAQIPDEAITLHGVGYLASQIGLADEGIQLMRRAISLAPEQVDLHVELAQMLYAVRQFDEAAEKMQTVIRLQPNRAQAYYQLSLIYQGMRRIDEWVAACQRWIELEPLNPDAHTRLATAYLRKHYPDAASHQARAALHLKPDHTFAWETLGVAMMAQGRIPEGCDASKRGMQLLPDRTNAWSNYLFMLQYLDAPLEIIAGEHLDWGRYVETRIIGSHQHRNLRDPLRRLRIGYVSGDFRSHAMEFFIEPILANHDRNEFELIAYCNHFRIDPTSRRLQTYFHRWHQVHDLSDEQFAALVLEDQIDILIDLSIHSSANRLLVFARKPAPVQITYLGYPGTTGLTTIDYRITAPGLDLPGVNEGSEKLLMLPQSYFCYQPPAQAPAVADAPALSRGFVTFGSFIRLAKLSDRAVAAWAKILHAVPTARLQLMSTSTDEPATREFIRGRFEANRLGAERIALLPSCKPDDFLAAHDGVDIVLDTFPYNGGTTTLHALWMGVPVISLAERRAVSRLGMNILNALGLNDLAAESEADYIAKACALAANIDRLSELRRGMRDRMQTSPLMNGPQFTRDLESLYRQAWKQWIENANA